MSHPQAICIRDRHGFERTVPIGSSVTLGRQSACDIVLSDSMVSRTHLRLEFDGEAWWAEDLHSSHGTYHQDERIGRIRMDAHTQLRLADGAYLISLRSETSYASEVNLQAILQTAHLLTGQVELDDLLEQTLDRLLAISRTDRGFIMLPEGGELEVKVQRNLGQDMEKDIHLSMSSVQRVFERGEAIWIHNVAADEAMMAQQSIMDLQLKTILCLPLVVKGHTVGVTYLDSRKIICEPVDRATFEAIVSLCAVAIERTRMTEESRRNEIMAKVGHVSSSIVHDFKNALFVIDGHAQMLEALATSEKMRHHIAEIKGAVDRLSRMSTDVLDYAKVREPRRETLELGPYLTHLVEGHRQRATDAEITLTVTGRNFPVSLDRYRFARAVENLLTNALDAVRGREGGRIDLHHDVIQGEVTLRLEDNGKGIPRKVIRHIFEPFYSYGKEKGTGLGMATVKKIVEEHGGTIEVQSEEGLGTIVTLTLPDPLHQRLQEETSSGAHLRESH